MLGLSSVEADLLPELDDGVGLWKVGSRSFLVQHRFSSIEAPIVDTDGAMLDSYARTDLTMRDRDPSATHPFEMRSARRSPLCS